MNTATNTAGAIINLTLHMATEDQRQAGVQDLDVDLRPALHEVLDFKVLPDVEELESRAKRVIGLLADQLKGVSALRGAMVMIGGMPAFMPPLQEALLSRGVIVGYAFSTRDCVEEPQSDGSVKKTYVFRHKGFTWVTAVS